MNEKRLLFRYSLYWGRCETPYFHCLAAFDVWFWRQKSSNEKRKKCQDSRNSHTPTVYNAFSQISVHFCHYLTHFSLISHSILNRFSCNFAGTIGRYYGNFPINMAKFDRVLQKLLMRLLWNLLEYFQKLFILTSIQTSILNRLPCNFAGTIGRYYGNRPVNLASLLKYFKSY